MMLWLSGLMGLLAVGAFTLLWFLPFRKTAETDTTDDEAVSMADALTGPKVEAAGAVMQIAGSTPDTAAEAASAGPSGAYETPEAAVLSEDQALRLTADDADADAADWFSNEADTPEFEEFDPQEDDLIVVWDDSGGPVPNVAVVRNDDDPSVARVILGDTILAHVRTRSDVICDHVSVVPLSRARTLGWA